MISDRYQGFFFSGTLFCTAVFPSFDSLSHTSIGERHLQGGILLNGRKTSIHLCPFRDEGHTVRAVPPPMRQCSHRGRTNDAFIQFLSAHIVQNLGMKNCIPPACQPVKTVSCSALHRTFSPLRLSSFKLLCSKHCLCFFVCSSFALLLSTFSFTCC